MIINLICNPPNLTNVPRHLSYKQNCLKHIEDINEDYIPHNMDEIPNRIKEYCPVGNKLTNTNLNKFQQKHQRHTSLIEQTKECQSFSSFTQRSSQKNKSYTFIQSKLKNLNTNSIKLDFLKRQYNDNDNSYQQNEKRILLSPKKNKQLHQQYTKQQYLNSNQVNKCFTEYYKNAEIEYIN